MRLGRAAIRRRTAALVAGSALAVLSGCSAIGLTPTTGTDAAKGPATGDTGSWTLVSAGTRTATPTAVPGYSPSATPAFTLVPLPTPTDPSAAAGAGCSGSQPLGSLAGLDVTPSATSAKVTWYDVGDPTLVQYRLTAIPQEIVGGLQDDLRWMEIVPEQRCAAVTATVTGLTPGSPYIFSLDAVLKNYNSDGNRTSTIARSLVVYTP